jgi:hypothetical protein
MRQPAPLKLYEETVWEVFDPEQAQTVAVFHNRVAAIKYVNERNKERAGEQ